MLERTFVLRNRSQQTFVVGSEGLSFYKRTDDEWTKLNSDGKGNAVGYSVHSGQALSWDIAYTEEATTVSVNKFEIVIPKLDRDHYAVSTA